MHKMATRVESEVLSMRGTRYFQYIVVWLFNLRVSERVIILIQVYRYWPMKACDVLLCYYQVRLAWHSCVHTMRHHALCYRVPRVRRRVRILDYSIRRTTTAPRRCREIPLIIVSKENTSEVPLKIHFSELLGQNRACLTRLPHAVSGQVEMYV